MRKYGLIGYPLGHSFSKKYFTAKFDREAIEECLYDNFPMADIDLLPGLIKSEPLLSGLNVTIPWKTAVIKYLDHIDPSAAEIGAVNVLKISREGSRISIAGYNSDIKGIADSIGPALSNKPGEALVLGTGGSSKAVCYVLREAQLSYHLVSRVKKKGVLTYSDLDAALLKRIRLIVNTTPLGMYPNVDSSPEINYRLLDNSHTLFDLVYNPEITTFLKKGQERGCTIITGLKMLESQAERSWEIWNDPALR